ncbi:hypothetical protein A4X09_0g1879 [Tilletia walkeri]|uniref:Uncharacterized protein n=1 Tax=Tilletia walkeri TaxID=117179 RepID=A0A8X7T7M7_9BASI|nr:hypothetical protein A4X09_0g1879 [Tilletia walkeri]
MPFSRSGETRVDKTHGHGTEQQGSKTEEYSVEVTDRGARNKRHGVKTEGKVRETTVTTQPLRQGKGSATTRRTEGVGREDKTCNTSEPANALGQEGEWTASMRNPLKGRDRRQRMRGQDPPPTRRCRSQD